MLDLSRRELGLPLLPRASAGTALPLAAGGSGPDAPWSLGEAQKLSVEAVLKGHRGCVNRLAWNEAGNLLASGSDDRMILIWRYPDAERAPLALDTSHQANIFGVRWLPACSDTRLVSGAMDYTVQLHTLQSSPASMPTPVRSTAPMRRHPELNTVRIRASTVLYACHAGRVKAVEVEPGNPHLFWSAAEDGIVRQFDARLPTADQSDYDSPNALLAVVGKGGRAPLELKGLAINAIRPHELALAAGDQYVRIYDRRMLSAASPRPFSTGRGRGGQLGDPLLCLAPPHMCWGVGLAGGRRRSMHTTYVAFSNRGDKILATYHGDHAYAFDITHSAAAASAAAVPMGGSIGHGSSGSSSSSQHGEGVGGRGGVRQPVHTNGSLLWGQMHVQHQQQDQQHDVDLFSFPPATWAPAAALQPPSSPAPAGTNSRTRAGGSSSSSSAAMASLLPPAAERAKADGNLFLFNKQCQQAVAAYSEALRAAPWAGLLRTNRALALLQRDWEGDAAAALRDAELALALDSSNPKAHYRRLQALRGCRLLRSAAAAAAVYRARFSAHVTPDLEELEEGISSELAEQARQAEAAEQQRQARQQARRRRGFSRERPRREGGSEGQPAAGVAAGTAGAGEAAAGVAAGAGAAEGTEGAAAGAAAASTAVVVAPGEADEDGVGPPTAMELHFPDSDSEDWAGGDSDDSPPPASSSGSGASSIDERYAAALKEAARQALVAPAPETSGAAAGAGDGASGAAGSSDRVHWGPGREPWLWGAEEGGRRMLRRYIGHCNIQTDIKEAVFLGAADDLVAAGSDDGRVFLYDAATGECVRVLEADEDVANCVAPHPHLPVLATSGIEHTIKLWSPHGEQQPSGQLEELITRNQERMREGPAVLRGVDPRILAALADNPQLLHALVARAARGAGHRAGGEDDEEGGEGEEEEEEGSEDGAPVREVTCRMA